MQEMQPPKVSQRGNGLAASRKITPGKSKMSGSWILKKMCKQTGRLYKDNIMCSRLLGYSSRIGNRTPL